MKFKNDTLQIIKNLAKRSISTPANPGFRIFDISFVPGDIFYKGLVSEGLIRYQPKQAKSNPNDATHTKYVKINTTDFKGSEHDLLTMSSEQFHLILQDPKKLEEILEPHTKIEFASTRHELLQDMQNEDCAADKIGKGFYQKSNTALNSDSSSNTTTWLAFWKKPSTANDVKTINQEESPRQRP